MKVSAAALVIALSAGSASSFSLNARPAFVVQKAAGIASSAASSATSHSALCSCSSCVGRFAHRSSSCPCPACSSSSSSSKSSSISIHPARCTCSSCSKTVLFASVEEPEVKNDEAPVADVASDAADGAAADRPRKVFKSKPKGLPLSDFKAGDSVKGKVKSVTAYGAFMDIGAETDALLHISNLSVDFVSNVKDVLEAGKEYDVRILTVDAGKGQIALTLLTAEQEEEAAANAASSRPPKRENNRSPQGNQGGGGGGGNNQQSSKRDDSAVLRQLTEKGWDDTLFVTGTVVSTVDFGAFVRVDGHALNAEIEASSEFDGLVHISAMATGRVSSVSSVCKVGDEVKVRVKNIDDRKVSLTMVSVEDEAAQAELRGSSGGGAGGEQGFQGNKDWKEAMESLQKDMPSFSNRPMVVDNREK